LWITPPALHPQLGVSAGTQLNHISVFSISGLLRAGQGFSSGLTVEERSQEGWGLRVLGATA